MLPYMPPPPKKTPVAKRSFFFVCEVRTEGQTFLSPHRTKDLYLFLISILTFLSFPQPYINIFHTVATKETYKCHNKLNKLLKSNGFPLALVQCKTTYRFFLFLIKNGVRRGKQIMIFGAELKLHRCIDVKRFKKC